MYTFDMLDKFESHEIDNKYEKNPREGMNFQEVIDEQKDFMLKYISSKKYQEILINELKQHAPNHRM